MAASLLEQILAGLAPDGTGHFCYECGSPDVVVETGGLGERFQCDNGHVAQRSFLFDGRAEYSVEEGKLVHTTVAAIIKRDDKTLLFRRTRFPVGFTIPAGHLEAGESPRDGMAREVHEEVGLMVADAREVWAVEPPLLQDRCRRGADHHRWHLFHADAEGQVRLGEEGCDFGWLTDGQIYDLAVNRLLVPAVREVFHRLGVV